MPNPEEPTLIKKHADRRPYNTIACTYVAPEDLAHMVRRGEDFVVREAGSGGDITPSILMLITPTTEH
jgi:polyhydroxyalkanoate synthesis regulator protein